MVGQRLDLDILEEIALDDPAERARAEDRIREAGVLHPPGGSDYFVFPKGALGTLPPFLVGRPGWDNWMIFRATQLGIPVVDASGCSLVVHQNHDYQHVPGGTVRYEGPEADYNRGLLGGWDEFMTPEYAGWRLTGDRLERRPWWTKSSKIGTRVFAASHPRLRFLVPAVRRWLTARERRAEKRAG